jgi:hypothetical protein
LSYFFDFQLKNWKHIRRAADILGVISSILLVIFVIAVMWGPSIPSFLLAAPKTNYAALKDKEVRQPARAVAHRKTKTPPSQMTLNTGEDIRGAFYVMWDPASFSSMREYIHQVDFLFPEWLHVLTPDGHLQAFTELNMPYPVIDSGHVAQVDPKLMPFLKQKEAEAEVFPLINNFDPITGLGREDIVHPAHFQGRPRTRQSHLHASGHQQHLPPRYAGGTESDRTAVRRTARCETGSLSSAILRRSGY